MAKTLVERFVDIIFDADDAQRVQQYVVNNVVIPTVKNTTANMLTTSVDVVTNSLKAGIMGAIFGSNNIPQHMGRMTQLQQPGYIQQPRYRDYTGYAQPSVPQQHYATPNTGVQGGIPASGQPVYNPHQPQTQAQQMVFRNIEDANMVLASMRQAIATEGKCTLAQYYNFCGQQSTSYLDSSVGWRELNTARPIRLPDGWTLNMPSPSNL